MPDRAAVDTGRPQTLPRAVFLLLAGGTWLGAMATMAHLLGGTGMGLQGAAMLACFGLAIPMVVTGFWNAALGTAILAVCRDPLRTVAPFAYDRGETWDGRLAIVMPVRNEAVEPAVRTLRGLLDGLDALGLGEHCEVWLLSDSDDPEILAAEEAQVAAWRRETPGPARIHYRHRPEPEGFKAGNLWDFVTNHGERFAYMLVLDADSAMTPRAVDRLMRVMAARPKIGILQPLAVGAPAESVFARSLQFGMRQGMFVHSVGAAWWQGDAGPYWGHNAVIRMAPFREACGLPRLRGRSPLAGAILSHDQVEAARMRAHGHAVRLLPIEDGSLEAMPPTLFDFVKRELRWALGNLQYLKLLGRRGFRAMGRLQMAMAVMMYTAAPAWFAFMGFGLAAALGAGDGFALRDDTAKAVGIGLFAGMLGITFAPKVFGTLHTLLNGERRRGQGGVLAVVAGALSELALSVFLAPVVMLSVTIFIAGLPFGRKLTWTAQTRDAQRVPLGRAVRGLWPQVAIGGATAWALAVHAPAVLPWAAPVLIPLVVSPLFAWATAHPAAGALVRRLGLWATPEERGMKPVAPAPDPRRRTPGASPAIPAPASRAD
ncbi:membrane glycosyltransferase [Limimonas halophila]|uniref:Glucans biosynthesis glucosyltransferase H n=1 Tax=Limimonas halophila TaxID=1082479 RepID=A0A1G7KXX4_9PROT|nr:glucans biosynthesis glucosyltransferase MdoH [Limimonas halophila]SDF41951.1 membrane glycosyltransferase [Limimonas halophila]